MSAPDGEFFIVRYFKTLVMNKSKLTQHRGYAVLYRLSAIIIYLQFISLSLQAQSEPLTVRGTVKSQEGDLLSDVTVAVKGSGTSTLSDKDGKYSIEFPGQKSFYNNN